MSEIAPRLPAPPARPTASTSTDTLDSILSRPDVARSTATTTSDKQLSSSTTPSASEPVVSASAHSARRPSTKRSSLKEREKEDRGSAAGIVVIERPLDLEGLVEQPERRPSARRLTPPRLIDLPPPTFDAATLPQAQPQSSGLDVDLGTPVAFPPRAIWRERQADDVDPSRAPPTPTDESGYSETAGGTTMMPSTTFNSLGSSQRPILAGRIDGAGSGDDQPSVLESGLSRPSWKKGNGRIRTYENSRLAALGFEEELTRDFDFWASWGVALCNIGFLPGAFFHSPCCYERLSHSTLNIAGTFLGVITALDTGGGVMYAFAWPISGLFMMALAAVLGEMASCYPVAGIHPSSVM